jgi:glycosyltransferase involved in cell wall biosynthesis
MKILSISSVPLLTHLGSGKTRLHWTNGLAKLGHEVDILQPSDFELWPTSKLGKKYRQALGVLFKVRNLLSKKKYDLIEFYGDEYWLLLLWLKKWKANTTILVAHVDGIELYDMDKAEMFWSNQHYMQRLIYNNTHRRFSAITFKYADKFVCGCSDELKYVFDQNLFSSANAACVSPGIDNEYHQLSFSTVKRKNIIFFGSWIDRKGIKNIPKVISAILDEHQTISFDIYGSWSAKSMILQQFSSHLHERINVHEKLSENELIKQLLSSAIFFFPTYSEGFGLATLEAMSCGIAVVTTPTGIGANLQDGVNAIICDFDDTSAMTEAIHQLINDEVLRSTIAHNGYLFAKQFVWENQVNLLEQQYQQWYNSSST